MNPLLEYGELPAFDKIKTEHVIPAVEQTLDTTRKLIDNLLASGSPHGWDSLLAPLETALERLHQVWSPVSHLNAVCNSDKLREAYNICLPQLSAFSTELGQHEGLYQAIRTIADGAEYPQLSTAQQQSIDNRLRDFRLNGIALDIEQRQKFKDIQQRLSALNARFKDNVLDATQAWRKLLDDESHLSGLPESALALARQAAEREGETGWLLTLEFPSYYPVITYADDRALREELYTAYTTRASECDPGGEARDNTGVMSEILELRHESAQLLGFASFAELSLETKMAESAQQVLRFLYDLADRSLPQAQQDLDDVTAFALEQGFNEPLQAWDIPYYSELLRQQRYALSQEELKPYFPDEQVISGLFQVVERLYGVQIKQREGVSTWHPDVRFYDIHEADGSLCGRFYLDLYARTNKRGGAWMDDYASRMTTGGSTQVPVAYLTCNFTPPIGDQPALLTHAEVITLFHEFGHGIHHMLTRINIPSVSGINGVAWDAVELPSQLMENWCWEKEALALISGHYQTGESLPDELFERMQAARNFQSAMQMVRQLEFALFDMRMHLEYDARQDKQIDTILADVRDRVAVVKPPAFNRFAHSFSHIFGGGYAAGYYSYKWAEVLSADAYSLFEENGIFDAACGRQFRDELLSQGGARDAMTLFIAFRGREPTIDALLRHSGLAA
jgi:oligopeptidase A